ncbi:hypothetical protein M011DRAFT_197710 [Sporormia fimetaria CBS 119925]|uniref:Uncharacterized protein n=1 Tax=Sporormia fimetaria CBS 119925 TaxID=1340428 RepID=A0A6A6V4K8_9PLEO|nr:hypothetical protein M011DRAFT_197710 [Sporormia fimetaria CBS 119925]
MPSRIQIDGLCFSERRMWSNDTFELRVQSDVAPPSPPPPPIPFTSPVYTPPGATIVQRAKLMRIIHDIEHGLLPVRELGINFPSTVYRTLNFSKRSVDLSLIDSLLGLGSLERLNIQLEVCGIPPSSDDKQLQLDRMTFKGTVYDILSTEIRNHIQGLWGEHLETSTAVPYMALDPLAQSRFSPCAQSMSIFYRAGNEKAKKHDEEIIASIPARPHSPDAESSGTGFILKGGEIL